MPYELYDVYTLDTEEYIGQFRFEYETWLMPTQAEIQAQFEAFCTLNNIDATLCAYEVAL